MFVFKIWLDCNTLAFSIFLKTNKSFAPRRSTATINNQSKKKKRKRKKVLLLKHCFRSFAKYF